jgi:hypothetical protein
MPVLTTLKICFTGLIVLTRYLNACPDSVKHFDINCFLVELDPKMLRPCYIESLNINCDVLSDNFLGSINKCLPALLRLKLTSSISAFGAGIILGKKHPLEEFTFVLDGRKPLGFKFKDNRDHCWYLCNSGDIRLATWDDIKELPKMAVVSSRPRRAVIDDQDSIRVVLD